MVCERGSYHHNDRLTRGSRSLISILTLVNCVKASSGPHTHTHAHTPATSFEYAILVGVLTSQQIVKM